MKVGVPPNIAKKLKPHAKNPVGNRPEMMLVDTSLNFVVHSCAFKHVALTKPLDDNDDNKLSMATHRYKV